MSNRDSGDDLDFPSGWKITTLRDACKSVTVGHVGSTSDFYQEDGILFLRTGNLMSGQITLDDVRYISRSFHNVLRKSQICVGDVLVSRVGYTGSAAVVPQGFPEANCANIIIIRPSESLDSFYLHVFINSPVGMRQNASFSAGSAQSVLNIGAITRSIILQPPLPEQRKIARILTTVDNLIEKTEALIAKHQAVKQGMMHDLFTRGVDEHGHLRLPYEEAPELYKQSELGWIPKAWTIEELRNVVEFWDGKRIPLKQADRDLMEGEFPYYGASGIIDYVDRYLFDDELILLGEDGENVVSRNLPLAFRVSGKCWVNNHAHVLMPLDGADVDFLTEYLESLDYSGIASGSAQPKITQKHLAKTRIALPSINEQRLITARLFTLAAKLRTEGKSAAKLRLQKTGLMQDLLTGKVRVKVDEPDEAVHV